MNRRFTILTHDHPVLHWDFLVEQEEVLWAWRLMSEPNRQSVIAVEPLPDHRKKYLDYEGPVSKNRGTVQQWDTGVCQLLAKSENEFVFYLEGNKLSGELKIVYEKNEQVWMGYL